MKEYMHCLENLKQDHGIDSHSGQINIKGFMKVRKVRYKSSITVFIGPILIDVASPLVFRDLKANDFSYHIPFPLHLLTSHKFCKIPFFCNKLIIGSVLNDPSCVKYDYSVTVLYC